MAIKFNKWEFAQLITLKNNNNVQVDISTLGASIVNYWVKDKNGNRLNVVLGYDSPNQYLKGNVYLGSVVGPWANRIDGGEFQLNGKTYQLDQNENTNHIHGGSCQIHKRLWEISSFTDDSVSLTLKVSKSEAGYAANIEITVTYRLSNDGELSIEYLANADELTPINLTQHSYFNLSNNKTVIEHFIKLNSDEFWSVNSASIPVEKMKVSNTEMDFRVLKKIAKDLDYQSNLLQKSNGFDHCWCLDGNVNNVAAIARSEDTGLEMVVKTDQMGIQFYTGNFLFEEVGRGNLVYEAHSGFCLEAQHYPNQINMEKYKGQCIYGPETPYKQQTIYKIGLF